MKPGDDVYDVMTEMMAEYEFAQTRAESHRTGHRADLVTRLPNLSLWRVSIESTSRPVEGLR
jgi:hypothetical protein